MCRRQGILALLSLCAFHASLAAGDPADAKRWLDSSNEAADSLQRSGVYASYLLTRTRLAQARAYALLGDIENTRSRLPYAGDTHPEWSSGGDGMVRELMVSLDLDEIHASLLKVLVDDRRTDDAFEYVGGLNAAQGRDTAYLKLGTVLARAGKSTRDASGLNEFQQAMFSAGRARGLLYTNRPDAARDVIMTIELAPMRVKAIFILGNRLIAEQDFDTVLRLLALHVLPERETAAIANHALSVAVLAGQLVAAEALAEQVEEPGARDGMTAMLAFALASQGQLVRADELFDNAGSRKAPTWEQVAVQLDRDEWLEAHYLAIEQPWRRTERLYQYARRKLDAGDKREADRIAALAAQSADQISAGSTRWLANGMLAGYYAKAGDPQAAAARAAEIPTDTPDASREQAKAAAAVVEAWARAGDAEHALREADQIEDPLVQAAGLTAAAQAANGNDQKAYRRLVTAAQQSLRSVDESQLRKRRAGWAKLVTMQCRVDDLTGAMKTAARATEAGEGAEVYAAIVTFTLEAGDLSTAEQAAKATPAGIAPGNNLDHRAQALAQVTAALAANGHGRKAAVLLEEIDQAHLRELATPGVADALIAQGEQAQAIELAMALDRDDARERAVGVLLRALAEQDVLPDPETLMRRVPERYGGELCWASAAAAGAGPQRLDPWLQALEQPSCRAFAFAGAAYAALAAPTDLAPADLFARLDPTQAEDRMAEAMQKNAAGQTIR